MENRVSEPGADDVMDLRLLVQRLLKRRWLFACTVFLISALFATYAMTRESVYRASVVLAPAAGGAGQSAMGAMLGQLGGLAALAGVSLGGDGSEVEEALAVLRSREFTESFIESENLIPVLFRSDWDAQAGQWREGMDPPTPAQAFRYFDQSVRRIIQSRNTGLIVLEIDWFDPEQAARWANVLVTRLNSEMRDRAIGEADRSVEFLKRELAGTDVVEIRQSINRLVEAQVNQRMLANVNEEYAFRVIDRAVPPDPLDPVSPNRLAIVVAGPLVGCILGMLLVLLLDQVGPRVKRTRVA